MAISKIILNGVTQMDLTADTVAAANLIAPNTAHGADGEAVVGSASSGGVDIPVFDIIWDDMETFSADSITCNKTYSQCLSLYQDLIFDAVLSFLDDNYEEQKHSLIANSYETASGNHQYDYIMYTCYYQQNAMFDMEYWSNGTIHIVSVPSKYQLFDALIFNIDWDNWQSGTITSLTCNKPEDIFDSGYALAIDENDTIYGMSFTGQAGADGDHQHTYYTFTYQTILLESSNSFDIECETDGTLHLVKPSRKTARLQSKTNISPTTSSQTITADSGYDGLSSVQINAMPSGTAGTPSATKGTVSNHQISVTPSVTNTTGYITGGTKTGTAVTVTASELASGNKSISANGTNIDVVGYSTVSVAVPFSTITVSSSNPTGGNNGDIWIKTS